MRLCLFEDGGASNFGPLTLPRPVFDLLCGAHFLQVKQCQAFAAAEVGCLVRPELADVVQSRRPKWRVNDVAWLRAGPVLMVNGRWVPPGPDVNVPTDPCVGTVDETVAFAVVRPPMVPGTVNDVADWCARVMAGLPSGAANGRLIEHPWDLVAINGDQLCADFEFRNPAKYATWSRAGWRPASTGLVGSGRRLLIHPTAKIDPQVVFDTTNGPVTIGRGAVVQAFSRLEGPCHVGRETQVAGAKIRAGTTLGPQCRIGGEVEAGIVQGYTNKYHDGFLGHSYLASWVNIGAGTQTSDLRNDYGPVTVTIAGQRVATGQSKVGCFIGDHCKTGLGCLLNTGTTVGPFCHLLPNGRLLPKYLPPFSVTVLDRLEEQPDLETLLATAGVVMKRRDRDLTPALAALYRHVFDATAAERKGALRPFDARRLRRTG